MAKKILAFVLSAVFLCLLLPLSVFANGPINLILGTKYTISYGEPIFSSNGSANGNISYDVNEGQLTNSAMASEDANHDEWYRASGGKSRVVVFDLGDICSIDEIKASFLQDKKQSVLAPRYVNVYFSVNGRDYELAKEISNRDVLVSDEVQKVNVEIDFWRSYAAKYVKIEFAVEPVAYCDEISVLGKKELTGREVYPDVEQTGYLQSVGEYKDIVKLYNGYYPDNHYAGVLTESELLPYIAYVNSKGEITSTMFDAILLSPCNVEYPNGSYLDGTTFSNMEDWELYAEQTFTDGQNLDSINRVAGKTFEALGKKGKIGIFLTVPYPAVSDEPFGDINQNGSSQYSQTYRERKAIIRWYINKCISAFDDKNYDHIELAGFCWLNDKVDYSASDHEEDLLIEFSEFVKSKDLLPIYSSGYISSGFERWQDFGFSAAVMKTEFVENVMNGVYTEGMLKEFAYTVFHNHLGVEIQAMDEKAFSDEDYHVYGYNYEKQLYQGSINGYMNALTVYDQGIDPGAFYNWCYSNGTTSKDEYLRRLYDITYQYVNGVYCNMPPELTDDTYTEQDSGKNEIVFELEINDSDSPWEDINANVSYLPQNGEITLSSDKNTLIYVPNDGFTGTDSFVISVSDGFNNSDEVMFTVKIDSAKVSNPQQETESEIEEDNITPKETMPVWQIITIIVISAAMLIGILVLVPMLKKIRESI